MGRAVITGIGCINSLGNNIDDIWNASQRGQTGISELKGYDSNLIKCKFGGRISGFKYKGKNMIGKNLMSQANKLELFAVIKAMENSKILDLNNEKCSLFLGNQLINLNKETFDIILKICDCGDKIDFDLLGENMKKLPPLNGVKILSTIPSHFISKISNIHGEGNLLYNGETSGLTNLIMASKEIVNEDIEKAVVASSFSPFELHEYLWLNSKENIQVNDNKSIPEELIFPFDERHSGIVYGEGAAAIIIENEEIALRDNKKIIAYIDNGEINTYPGEQFGDLSKEGFIKNIRNTLKYSNIEKNDIDLVFTNACSVKDWDNGVTSCC